MKNIPFLLLTLTLFLTSCKSESVEIYLTKHRIAIQDGVQLTEVNSIDTNKVNSLKTILGKDFKFLRYDTIHKDFLYCGTFDLKEEDINSQPLISHDEIIAFDTVSWKLELEKSAVEKIWKLQPSDKGFGQQFVLCINKKPVLKGYFVNAFHKFQFPLTTNYILFFFPDDGKTVSIYGTDEGCIDKDLKNKMKEIIKN